MDLTETRMNVRGQVCKKYGKITYFGLKSSQPLENESAHPTKHSKEYLPPGLSPHLTYRTGISNIFSAEKTEKKTEFGKLRGKNYSNYIQF